MQVIILMVNFVNQLFLQEPIGTISLIMALLVGFLWFLGSYNYSMINEDIEMNKKSRSLRLINNYFVLPFATVYIFVSFFLFNGLTNLFWWILIFISIFHEYIRKEFKKSTDFSYKGFKKRWDKKSEAISKLSDDKVDSIEKLKIIISLNFPINKDIIKLMIIWFFFLFLFLFVPFENVTLNSYILLSLILWELISTFFMVFSYEALIDFIIPKVEIELKNKKKIIGFLVRFENNFVRVSTEKENSLLLNKDEVMSVNYLDFLKNREK